MRVGGIAGAFGEEGDQMAQQHSVAQRVGQVERRGVVLRGRMARRHDAAVDEPLQALPPILFHARRHRPPERGLLQEHCEGTERRRERENERRQNKGQEEKKFE